MMPDLWGPPSDAEISAAENENARLSKRVKELETQNAELSGKIGQLEADNKLLQDAVDQWELVAASPGAVEDMARAYGELVEKVEQLQAERDAAVKDLKTVCNMMNICSMCKDHAEGSERCEGCEISSNWEWRGVQKEE